MYPVLFSLGEFEVRSQFVLVFLSGVLGSLVFLRESFRAGETRRVSATIMAVSLPSAYLGSYLNGVLFRLVQLWPVNEIALLFHGGLVSFGTIGGLLVSGYLVARKLKLRVLAVLDRMALVLPLAHAIGRIGCLLNGCCYGLETDRLLGMYLPGRYDEWAYRYPTQLILAFFNLGLFAWLWWRKNRVAPEGRLMLSFLFLYSVGRLLIDTLRDLPRVWGPFSSHQLTSIAILLITGYISLELRWAFTQGAGARG